MIAFSREFPDRIERQDMYELRRVLVARLQQASRGVTRRERVDQHRRFAEEWSGFAEERRLGLLMRAVALGPAVASEAGDLWRRSFLLALASQVDWAGAQGPVASVAERQAGLGAVAPLPAAQRPVRGAQVDLFAPSLAVAAA